MGLFRIFTVAMFCVLTSACGSDNDIGASETSTDTTAEASVAWKSVYYTWVSNWDPCTNNRLTIDRSKQISVSSCGDTESRILSDQDFAAFERQVAPVFQNLNAEIKCINQAIMDYSVYTYISAAGSSTKIYSYDEKEKCSRGDTAQAEQLQDLLGVLHDKYLPSSLSTED